MNIACTSCSARYGVADEKVIGKRVRITCKRCGTTLVIDGNFSPPAVSASTSVAPAATGRRASSTPAAPLASLPPPPVPAPDATFLVAFGDEEQERADVAQIVRLYRAGRLGPEALVWREGMPDWANPWDVEDIAAAFRRMGYARPSPAPGSFRGSADEDATHVIPSSPGGAPLFDDDETTNVVDSSRVPALRQASRSEPASSPVREEDEAPTAVVSSPLGSDERRAARQSLRAQRAAAAAAAARRTSSRPPERQAPLLSDSLGRRDARRRSDAPRADLFARQAYAGSEDEEARARVEATEAQARAEAESRALLDASDEPRLTGARNETSVLFSLDSLLKKEQKAAPPPQRVSFSQIDESLLVDSGSSLPVGGGIAPALSAPDFTAPVAPPPPRVVAADTSFDEPRLRSGSSGKLWIVAAVLILIAAGGGFVLAAGGVAPILARFGFVPAASVSTAQAAVSAPPPAVTEAPAAAATPAESASATASASAAPADSAAPAKTAATAMSPSTATPASPSPVVQRPAAAAPRETAEPSESEGSPSRPATATTAAPREEAAAAPAPAGGATFDAAAAKEALTSAAANAASCKEEDGPTGSGRVSITFAPSGRPTSVAITGDVAGSTVGSCVARLFRQTRVPAFSGEPVTVAKSFTIQ